MDGGKDSFPFDEIFSTFSAIELIRDNEGEVIENYSSSLIGEIWFDFVKPEKNSIFLKKGKTVISVENQKFSKSRMNKRTAPLNSSREI